MPNLAMNVGLREHIDRANRIALVHPIIEAFRQQCRLLAIRLLNETLHHPPAIQQGNHSTRQVFTQSGSSTDLTAPKSNFRFTPESGLNSDIAPCPVRANSGSRTCSQSDNSVSRKHQSCATYAEWLY